MRKLGNYFYPFEREMKAFKYKTVFFFFFVLWVQRFHS